MFVDCSRYLGGYQLGGVARVTEEILCALRESRVDTVLIRRNSLGRKTLDSGERFWKLLRSYRKLDASPLPALFVPDLALPPQWWSPREIRALRARGIRTGFVAYDVLPITNPEWFPRQKKYLFEAWLRSIAEADVIFPISNYVKKSLTRELSARDLPIPLSRTISMGSPTRFAEWDTNSPGKPVIRGSKSIPRILMVGTVELRKGLPHVLDALDILKSRGVLVELWVAGAPGVSDPGLVQRLRESCANGDARWVEDASDREVFDLYGRCDLVVAASMNEGFGLPILEALDRKAHVLARDTPVFREVGGDSVCFFDGGGAQIAEAIEHCLSSKHQATSSVEPDLSDGWRKSAEIIIESLYAD